jgi:hypothetical protein
LWFQLRFLLWFGFGEKFSRLLDLFLSWFYRGPQDLFRYLDDGGGGVAILIGRCPPKKSGRRGTGETVPGPHTMSRMYEL